MIRLLFQQIYLTAIVGVLIYSGSSGLGAQDVGVQISTRAAWVGSPIVLQLQIRDAQDYTPPEDFAIDGCDVQSAGTPSQSSQIMIINGRRSENRSVTMRYLITPRRAGEFEVPALEIKIDGKTQKTKPIRFVAKKSETGDLLLVEVEGEQDSVFVGQPLDIKLKIWVKPYEDRKNNIKLNEGQMWQLLSRQTSWGAFSDSMQELTDNRQRPGGKSVLRTDNDGESGEYYLYEISGTIYPTKPGKIDASDLQVVVNYPLALGRRRDPLDSFFSDSPFGGSSLMKEMMGDDFFSSPFSRRLTVTESRPVVAEANVNSTEVLAIPDAGRPVDYRGAVGQYKIVVEADPQNVTAGDPITLRIGIVGDGPMELVQAPPLHEIESLVNDFQVTDQALAGFVQDDTKVFVTTLRARSEEVTQIPPIPFSFFDPDQKAYQTVYSDPIQLEVEKAQSLAMDAIVSNAPTGAMPPSAGDEPNESATTAATDWQDGFSGVVNMLKQWWYVALIPPVCLVAFFSGKLALAAPALVRRLRSPMSKAQQAIDGATTESDLAAALQQYVADLTKKQCATFERAVGHIRETRADDVARQMEAFYHRTDQSARSASHWMASEDNRTFDELKIECKTLLSAIATAWSNRRRKAPPTTTGAARRTED